MERYLARNIKVALVYICIILLCIVITYMLGIIFVFGKIFKASLGVLFLIYLYSNRDIFLNVNKKYTRYLYIFILSGLITFLVGFIGLIIAVNLYLSIGGSL